MCVAMMRTLSRWAKPVLALPRSAKRLLVLALDAGLCVLAVWLAFYLRLEKFVPLTGPCALARPRAKAQNPEHRHERQRRARDPRPTQRPSERLLTHRRGGGLGVPSHAA